MKIITLIENHVTKSGLIAEHGLSFYIETENKKILFDTGQTSAFIANAKALGVDLTDIDYVVISHGHYDHTGGLYPFLKINTKAKVLAKNDTFLYKYHGPSKFIGTRYDATALENRIEFINKPTELTAGVFILPSIPIVNTTDTALHNFLVQSENGLVNDVFNDELFITLIKNHKLSVISSCSHRGITNALTEAMKHFNITHINTVVGGFHYKEENLGQFECMVSFFNKYKPEYIGVSHCSGVELYAKLKNTIPSEVFYNYTGNQINI